MWKGYLQLICIALVLFSLGACDDETSASRDQNPSNNTDTQGMEDVNSETDTTVSEENWSPPLVQGLTPLPDENPAADIVEVHLTASYSQVEVTEGIILDMLTYNGMYPGPLLQAKVGDEMIIHFTNDLDEPTTIHWHGLRISDEMDGNPRIQNPVQPGESFTYQFKLPEAGTFWYHPHVRTNEQVERGLQGMFIVHDPTVDGVYEVERAIILDDMLLNSSNGFPNFEITSRPEMMHGRNGNVLVTNGRIKEQTLQTQQGNTERWRIVNTANARTMNMSLSNANFRVIGVDGGRLKTPYTTSRLSIAVGQRYDIEVNYNAPGEVTFNTNILTFDENDQLIEVPIPAVVVDSERTGKLPGVINLPKGEELPDREITKEVTITIDAVEDPILGIRWRLNGQMNMDEPLFSFKEGDVVKITIENTAGPEHPFHLHGQFFQIIGDGRAETEQPGLKDTVLIPGQSTVEIIAYMDNPGQWMAHCHILEHAELGMMSEIIVEPAN